MLAFLDEMAACICADDITQSLYHFSIYPLHTRLQASLNDSILA